MFESFPRVCGYFYIQCLQYNTNLWRRVGHYGIIGKYGILRFQICLVLLSLGNTLNYFTMRYCESDQLLLFNCLLQNEFLQVFLQIFVLLQFYLSFETKHNVQLKSCSLLLRNWFFSYSICYISFQAICPRWRVGYYGILGIPYYPTQKILVIS